MTAEQLRLARLFLESIESDPLVRFQAVDFGNFYDHLKDYVSETMETMGITD